MSMNLRLYFLGGFLLLAFAVLLSRSTLAQSGAWPGQWTKIAETRHANTLICYRTWRCDLTETAMYGKEYKLNRTPNKTTTGPFVAQGTVTPNVCYAPPPQAQCKFWLTKK